MSEQSINLLLVEDDHQQRSLLKGILQGEGMRVEDVESCEDAILLLKKQHFDLVFSDWKLPQLSGLELLKYVKRNQPGLGFIMATAHGTIAHAVEAMNAGADDYLTKPFQRQEFLLCIEKVLKSTLLKRENIKLSEQLGKQQQLVEFVGTSAVMQSVHQRIARVASTDATILINGESGTGKELVARALHRLSDRNKQPFIAINCGAIPHDLAEAELFGAKKGAYTGAHQDKIGKFEAANHGTLFLDEIGELPLSLQAKLLRFLQEGTISALGDSTEKHIDVRVLTATHRDLPDMVKQGEFREDLFYRLNIVPITIPPLRERSEDILLLADFFLQHRAKLHGFDVPTLSTTTKVALQKYAWPGNVRELGNKMERFVLLGDEQELCDGLSQEYLNDTLEATAFSLPAEGLDWEVFEKQCLAQALERHAGNRTQAARFLGLSYKAFLYRLDKYALN
ncbi:sigma-54-dependent Fis family transcriptional regulator [Glaciecola sp. MH2013]|uniref:sigma-54-dependent transcriptional regulator n=1 Tax=Glaciecola sp. MH2013 TaxID=2785524 RepID=UPI0018A000B1|nr:sigma-54 dependent transcriptional regulator [Glaciecola sp. MH2013]MBF7074207.1 sigma-54-dependent Fis family transcriptional regulator [Glaciecola sp. MH2013]